MFICTVHIWVSKDPPITLKELEMNFEWEGYKYLKTTIIGFKRKNLECFQRNGLFHRKLQYIQSDPSKPNMIFCDKKGLN